MMQQSVLTPLGKRKSSGCGCLGGGCILALVICGLIVAALVWGAVSTYQGLKDMTATSEKPVAVYEATPEKYAAVNAKLKAFQEAYDVGIDATLTLSADEINTLIARDPDWSALRNHVFVTISGQRVAAQVSVPLSSIKAFEDRYFNGQVSMSFVTEDGKVRPEAVSVRAGDSEFPTWLVKLISSKEWLESIAPPKENKASAVAGDLQSVEIKDEKITIKARKTPQ